MPSCGPMNCMPTDRAGGWGILELLVESLEQKKTFALSSPKWMAGVLRRMDEIVERKED